MKERGHFIRRNTERLSCGSCGKELKAKTEDELRERQLRHLPSCSAKGRALLAGIHAAVSAAVAEAERQG